MHNDVRVIGSISTHLEIERYRVDDRYQNFKRLTQENHSWKNKVNFGAFNRYAIDKNFYGHVIVMYDLVQIKKLPNTSGVAARFGFDYQFRKRKKK